MDDLSDEIGSNEPSCEIAEPSICIEDILNVVREKSSEVFDGYLGEALTILREDVLAIYSVMDSEASLVLKSCVSDFSASFFGKYTAYMGGMRAVIEGRAQGLATGEVSSNKSLPDIIRDTIRVFFEDSLREIREVLVRDGKACLAENPDVLGVSDDSCLDSSEGDERTSVVEEKDTDTDAEVDEEVFPSAVAVSNRDRKVLTAELDFASDSVFPFSENLIRKLVYFDHFEVPDGFLSVGERANTDSCEEWYDSFAKEDVDAVRRSFSLNYALSLLGCRRISSNDFAGALRAAIQTMHDLWGMTAVWTLAPNLPEVINSPVSLGSVIVDTPVFKSLDFACDGDANLLDMLMYSISDEELISFLTQLDAKLISFGVSLEEDKPLRYLYHFCYHLILNRGLVTAYDLLKSSPDSVDDNSGGHSLGDVEDTLSKLQRCRDIISTIEDEKMSFQAKRDALERLLRGERLARDMYKNSDVSERDVFKDVYVHCLGRPGFDGMKTSILAFKNDLKSMIFVGNVKQMQLCVTSLQSMIDRAKSCGKGFCDVFAQISIKIPPEVLEMMEDRVSCSEDDDVDVTFDEMVRRFDVLLNEYDALHSVNKDLVRGFNHLSSYGLKEVT